MKRLIIVILALLMLAGCADGNKDKMTTEKLWKTVIALQQEKEGDLIWTGTSKTVWFEDELVYTEYEKGKVSVKGKATELTEKEKGIYSVSFDDLVNNGNKFTRTVAVGDYLEIDGVTYKLKEIVRTDPIHDDQTLTQLFRKLMANADYTNENGVYYSFIDDGKHYYIRQGNWPAEFYDDWQITDYSFSDNLLDVETVNSDGIKFSYSFDCSEADKLIIYGEKKEVYVPYRYTSLNQQQLLDTIEGTWSNGETVFTFSQGKMNVTDKDNEDATAYITGIDNEGHIYKISYDLNGNENTVSLFISTTDDGEIRGLMFDGSLFTDYRTEALDEGQVAAMWDQLTLADSFTNNSNNDYLIFDLSEEGFIIRAGNWKDEDNIQWKLLDASRLGQLTVLRTVNEQGTVSEMMIESWQGDSLVIKDSQNNRISYDKDVNSCLNFTEFFHTVAGFWHNGHAEMTYEFTEQGEMLISDGYAADRKCEIVDFRARHYHYYITYTLDGIEKTAVIHLLPANSGFTDVIDIDEEVYNRLFV